MKIIFTYTDEPDVAALPKDKLYNTSLEIPDGALLLPDIKERIVTIAEQVANFTGACLFVSANQVGLKHYPVKTTREENRHYRLRVNFKTIVLSFQLFKARYSSNTKLKILAPFPPPATPLANGRKRINQLAIISNLTRIGTHWCRTEADYTYANDIEKLAQAVVTLLNTGISETETSKWTCLGFHPWWTDNTLINRSNKQRKKFLAEQRRAQKAAERRQAKEAKLKEQGIDVPEPPQSGAGRTYGARPGKFMGVQMRSQLEIRFAAQLQERGIQWVYEGEVLGEGGYLVDFYLPEHGVWVEVKGRLEARDNYLLKEVAAFLKSERKQRLFVFMQSKALVVNPSGFREIKLDEFWRKIESAK